MLFQHESETAIDNIRDVYRRFNEDCAKELSRIRNPPPYLVEAAQLFFQLLGRSPSAGWSELRSAAREFERL